MPILNLITEILPFKVKILLLIWIYLFLMDDLFMQVFSHHRSQQLCMVQSELKHIYLSPGSCATET